MRERNESEREGAGAEAGAGDPPERRPSPPPPKRKGGRKRGDSVILSPDLERLVRIAGGDKPAPDVSAEERHYSRSLRIRRMIMDFLETNAGTTWRNLPELHARAGNYAGCSSVTAARWVYQFTRVGMPYQVVDAIEYVILERREG